MAEVVQQIRVAGTLRELFSRHRDRLKRTLHLRLSRRLASRVDDSDVLQEAYLDDVPPEEYEPGCYASLQESHPATPQP